MLTPVTPPCYLTANQSENCAPADHTPCEPLPCLDFKNALLKPTEESGFWALAAPDSLLGVCNKRCTFLHHTPVSVDWLYSARASGPKFGSVTIDNKSADIQGSSKSKLESDLDGPWTYEPSLRNDRHNCLKGEGKEKYVFSSKYIWRERLLSEMLFCFKNLNL